MSYMMHSDGGRSPTQDKPQLLLIEEHIPTAMSLAASLTRAGCEVEVATSGKAALQLAHDREFDLIALDPDLPDAGGFDAFLHLRQIPALSATPIVFLARRSDDAGWRGSLELGAADYIEKPFYGSAFVRRMLSHLKARPTLAKIP